MKTMAVANISENSIKAIKELENKINAQDEKIVLIAYQDTK